MVPCGSVWTSGTSMHVQRRTHIPAMDSGGPGKHGEVGAFLVDGFQVGLLADQDDPGITTVYGLYGGEPWVLRVYPHAVWVVQRTGNISASHAEDLEGAEPHVLCHLLG